MTRLKWKPEFFENPYRKIEKETESYVQVLKISNIYLNLFETNDSCEK